MRLRHQESREIVGMVEHHPLLPRDVGYFLRLTGLAQLPRAQKQRISFTRLVLGQEIIKVGKGRGIGRHGTTPADFSAASAS